MMKFSLTAFTGLTSLLLTGISLFFIQLVDSKIRGRGKYLKYV
ncbi:MAG: hypothetical protein ACJAS1_004578 [Oleiphilaceae bacterium]|jgi:hypothetical protein